MTAPIRGSQQSTLPASQTAPVAEFRCLYTPDIRKKQKKWQDGFLKFHTFNNRVMVYDQARNFLGDTYYKDSNELHEGDELTLDKGVMVEIADAIGVTQTDLKPLFEKKPKEAPPPPNAPPRRFQPPSQVARPQPTPSTSTARASAQQLRHKSLNALLGTSKGPIGKSVPIKSPYQARQEKEREKENDFAVNRAPKRQKITHKSTSSATLRLSSPAQDMTLVPREDSTMRVKPSGAEAPRKSARPIPPGAPIITLDELDDIAQPSSPASLPSTPPAVLETASRTAITPPRAARPAIAAKPVVQTPKIPRGKVPVPSVKALETPRAPVPPSSPPVSASNRLTNVDFAIQPTPAKESTEKSYMQLSPLPPLESTSPPRNLKAKSLRLSKGVKRGTLMICQPPTTLPRSRESSEAQAVTARQIMERNLHDSRRESPALANASAPEATSTVLNAAKPIRNCASRLAEEPIDEFHDDPEVMHGLMDQQLLVSGMLPTETMVLSDSPEDLLPRPKIAISALHNIRKPVPQKARKSVSAKATAPVEGPSTVTRPVREPTKKSQAAERPTPPGLIGAETTGSRSKAVSPALSIASDSRSRTASPSPRKLAALSTGGFRKNPKTTTLHPTHPNSDKLSTSSHSETVALPPHPLRANKRGPVVTTTELAAMLQQPKKRLKALADPIENGGDAVETSPNRKFRRVRSENDAPIPSTSEDWEKKNLQKAAPMANGFETRMVGAAPKVSAAAGGQKSELAALIQRTDPRKKFVRTQSLTVDTSVPTQGMESPMVSPVVDKDIGPWSTDAFDLFDWRPPGREKLGT